MFRVALPYRKLSKRAFIEASLVLVFFYAQNCTVDRRQITAFPL